MGNREQGMGTHFTSILDELAVSSEREMSDEQTLLERSEIFLVI